MSPTFPGIGPSMRQGVGPKRSQGGGHHSVACWDQVLIWGQLIFISLVQLVEMALGWKSTCLGIGLCTKQLLQSWHQQLGSKKMGFHVGTCGGRGSRRESLDYHGYMYRGDQVVRKTCPCCEQPWPSCPTCFVPSLFLCELHLGLL